jgi:hypothetical protein
MTSRRLITARQAAEKAGFKSPETILRWWRKGYLDGVARRTPTGRLRFDEDRFEALLKEGATTERGSVTRPAGRRPTGNVIAVTRPTSEED